jgi:curli production assembly/transport component CsgF
MTKLSFLFLFLLSSNLYASELIYTPINPSFGGYSGNGAVLLNQANAENTYKDPDAVDPFATGSTLDNFKETLNRQILSQLAAKIVTDAFGSSGSASGVYTTTDYKIEIDTGDPNITKIHITELATGTKSTIEIPVI